MKGRGGGRGRRGMMGEGGGGRGEEGEGGMMGKGQIDFFLSLELLPLSVKNPPTQDNSR
jgi:hypothetical protein